MDRTPQSSCDVLVFSAHPDDAEMAMGGTLLRLVDTGYRLVHCSLTAGQMGAHGDEAGRRAEFESACRFLNCDGRILTFRDTEVENSVVARKEVAAIIRALRPQIIFAPYHTNAQAERGGIAHADHYTAGALIRDAAKFARMGGLDLGLPPHEVRRLFFYMIPSNVIPNIIVDVSSVIDRTTELIRCYREQMAISIGGTSVEELFRTKRAALGVANGVRFAEPFIADELLMFEPITFFSV